MAVKNEKQNSTSIFIISLYLVFAITAIALVLLGGGAYKKLNDAIGKNAALRTTLSLTANKARSGDRMDAWAVETLKANPNDETGVSAFVITLLKSDDGYMEDDLNWIYFYRSSLYEIPRRKRMAPVTLDDSPVLITTDGGFHAEQDVQNGIMFTAADSDGRERWLYLYPRSTYTAGGGAR